MKKTPKEGFKPPSHHPLARPNLPLEAPRRIADEIIVIGKNSWLGLSAPVQLKGLHDDRCSVLPFRVCGASDEIGVGAWEDEKKTGASHEHYTECFLSGALRYHLIDILVPYRLR